MIRKGPKAPLIYHQLVQLSCAANELAANNALSASSLHHLAGIIFSPRDCGKWRKRRRASNGVDSGVFVFWRAKAETRVLLKGHYGRSGGPRYADLWRFLWPGGGLISNAPQVSVIEEL